MAYKPHTPVVEESQGVMIARALASAGHAVLIADPVALENAIAVLGDAVTAMGSAQSAIQAASVVVISTPAPEFAALTAADFADGRTRRTVLDCWRVLSADVADSADVVYLGRG
jgi:UDPglucose 6-dehydrogenase